jgi:biotin carboxyl carrier protein
MIFEVEINGRVRSVAIEGLGAVGPEGGRFRVAVDGVPTEVDGRPTELGLSLVFPASGRSVDVSATARAAGEWFIQLRRVSLTALVDGRRYDRGRPGDVAVAGEQRLVAPMPGRVVRILVKPGDEVARRQGLVVMEAMKMENELTSPKTGRVKQVAVAEGASVDAGRLLVIVE